MLGIGLILLALAVILLALALRGRVVARGQFCRKCRFDLAGLDPDRPDAACPECGRALHAAGSTRPCLRRPRKGLVVAAFVCLLLSVPPLLTRSAAVRAWLLPRVPDSVLATLEGLDFVGADEEIVVRLTDPLVFRAAFGDRVDRAIAAVLGLKLEAPAADHEIVLAALRNAQFNDAQAIRFFESVIEARVVIRDRAHPHQNGVPSAWAVRTDFADYFPPGRMFGGGNPAYTIHFDFQHGGPTQSTTLDREAPTFGDARPMRFLGGGVGQPAENTPLRSPGDVSYVPGDSIQVHAGLSVRIYSPRSPGPVVSLRRVTEQQVQIVAPDEPLMPIDHDPVKLADLASTLTMRQWAAHRMGERRILVSFVLMDAPPMAHAALRSTLVSDGLSLASETPTEFRPGTFPAGVQSHGIIGFQATIRDQADVAQVDGLTSEATADFIVRPDADAAYRYAELESLVAGELIFRGVRFAPAGSAQSPGPVTAEVHAPPAADLAPGSPEP